MTGPTSGRGATVLDGAAIERRPGGRRTVPGNAAAPGVAGRGRARKVERLLTDEQREGITLNSTLYVELAEAHRAAHEE